jgi:flagellar biosynthetic protein FlhB
MAEEFNQNKTEAPTQRRREEARQKGQVAFSTELSTGIILLAGIAGLWLGARALGTGLLSTMRSDLLNIHHAELGPREAQTLLASLFGRGADLNGFLLGVLFVTGVAAGVLQVGVHLAPELLVPNWEKLSPAHGWARLFSLRAVMRGVMAVLKVAAIALLLLWVLKGRSTAIANLSEGNLAGAAAQGWDLVIRLALAAAAALVLFGVIDYLFQRWRHEQSLMMSRQEVKEEVKREEGDPLIRARIRKMQRELSRKRMFEDVPRATVVITNPTHLAIALQYERGTMAAPRVLAKGAGDLARRIVDRARRHAVPVVERKEVAQALYKAVKVGQEIPTALYYAVAEVLAYLHRLRGAA